MPFLTKIPNEGLWLPVFSLTFPLYLSNIILLMQMVR